MPPSGVRVCEPLYLAAFIARLNVKHYSGLYFLLILYEVGKALHANVSDGHRVEARPVLHDVSTLPFYSMRAFAANCNVHGWIVLVHRHHVYLIIGWVHHKSDLCHFGLLSSIPLRCGFVATGRYQYSPRSRGYPSRSPRLPAVCRSALLPPPLSR